MLEQDEIHRHGWEECDSVKLAEQLNYLYNAGKGETHIKSIARVIFLENRDLADALKLELNYWCGKG